MILAALAASAAVLASASAAQDDVEIFGVGSMTCGDWLSSGEMRREGEAWLLGYWSGLNRLNQANGAVGGRAEGTGIIREVQANCTNHEQVRLEQATYDAYLQLQRTGR